MAVMIFSNTLYCIISHLVSLKLTMPVMTIDGVWSAIGSSNFDDRSFETNDEVTLGIRDAATAQRLDAVFEKYAPIARKLSLRRGASADCGTS